MTRVATALVALAALTCSLDTRVERLSPHSGLVVVTAFVLPVAAQQRTYFVYIASEAADKSRWSALDRTA